MALEKATIKPDGKAPIAVLFNPTQYSLDKGNQIAEIGVPGLAAPILQYARGNARTLSVELLFDTYEAGKDVRTHTDKIYGLLAIERSTHVPPICTFAWGSLRFRCVVETVNGRFTLFFPDGRPARATLTVAMKEFTEVGKLVRSPPTESADHAKSYVVRQGDTLSSIAAAEYGDPALWRAIARANRIVSPRALRVGRTLVIPPIL